MVQNILTLLIVLAAAGYTVSQLVRMWMAPPENQGCNSCGLTGSCSRVKKKTEKISFPVSGK